MEGLERFKGLGAGKRQAWTPIRSHGCGLGTPVGCEGLANGTWDRPEEAMELALGSLLPALKGLGAGKRQAWTPLRSHGCGLGTPVGCEGLAALEEAMDLAVGSLWPALEASLWTPVG